MDQTIRNKLRGVVTQCRKLLEDSVSQELQGKFGIYAGTKGAVQVDDDAQMTNLSAEERSGRSDILDHFEHIKARGFRPKEALDQLIREIAYTHLNRLCAYKMMDARQVYIGNHRFRDAVGKGFNSNGVKFYLADHPDDERLYNTGRQDIAYRHFLDWLGSLLSDAGVGEDENAFLVVSTSSSLPARSWAARCKCSKTRPSICRTRCSAEEVDRRPE
jgi:hypothetical protein